MVKTKVPKLPFSEYKNQLLAAICVNIISVAHGCAIGWLSPVILSLQSPQSPLSSGPLSVEEASWIGAVFCLGGITGNLTLGVIANNFGKKVALCVLAFPQLAFWTTIITTRHASFLYFARICAGAAGGGAFVSIPLFIADIANKEVRGSLGSFLLFAVNIGILLGFIVGANLSYSLVPCVIIVLPILYFIFIIFFPETPQVLYKRNDEEGARKSLQFYKNLNPDKPEDKAKLELAFQELKSRKADSEIAGVKLSFKDFFCKEGRRAMCFGFGVVSSNILSGCFATVMYAASIFKDSGSNFDPNTSAIIVACAQLFGTYVSTLIVDKFGRKPLMATSSLGTAIGLFTTGCFSFLSNYYDLSAYSWVPVASVAFAIFSASVALLPLTFVVLAEVLPQKIRPIGSSICNGSLNFMAFTQLKVLPILVLTIGVHGVMWICASIACIGFLFFLFVVPETKGKSI